jgi:hypothetical protein
MKWWLCHFSRAVITIYTSYSFEFGPTLNLHLFMGGARQGKLCQTKSYGAYGCISLDLRERQNNQGKKKVPRLRGVISHMPDRTQGRVLYLTRSLQVQDTRNGTEAHGSQYSQNRNSLLRQTRLRRCSLPSAHDDVYSRFCRHSIDSMLHPGKLHLALVLKACAEALALRTLNQA